MLFEQDDKLCKQDIKSFEQHIKSSEQVSKSKTRTSLPGFRINQASPAKFLWKVFKISAGSDIRCNSALH